MEGCLLRFTQTGIATLVQHCMTRRATRVTNPQMELAIVSFDIPEDRRADRLAFRKLLKHAGFKKVHKSTWIGRPDLARHLIYLARLRNLESEVKVYFGSEKVFNN